MTQYILLIYIEVAAFTIANLKFSMPTSLFANKFFLLVSFWNLAVVFATDSKYSIVLLVLYFRISSICSSPENELWF